MINVTSTERAHFTLPQAVAMLPLLRLIVADIQLAHRELSERRLDFHRLQRRRDGKTSQWHDDEVEETRADIQTESLQLDAYIAELEKLGVTLRSAEDGVVNFPTKSTANLRFMFGSWVKWISPPGTVPTRALLIAGRCRFAVLNRRRGNGWIRLLSAW